MKRTLEEIQQDFTISKSDIQLIQLMNELEEDYRTFKVNPTKNL